MVMTRNPSEAWHCLVCLFLKGSTSSKGRSALAAGITVRSLVLASFVAISHCCAFSSDRSCNISWKAKRNTSLQQNSLLLWASQATTTCFSRDPPYLALITEPDACDTPARMDATVKSITSAVSTGQVDLVSVRVVQPEEQDNMVCVEEFKKRVVQLTTRLVELSAQEQHAFSVVVTSDWVDAAVQASAHGIHVKERHRSRIPEIRQEFLSSSLSSVRPLIGTSAHSVSSALDVWSLYQPDYLFVGTCYKTASHPEKDADELEGPMLPGNVCRAFGKERPVVLAIGGIDEHNCREPVVVHGADGVATIRSVLQSPDPRRTVELMNRNMGAV